MSDNIGAEFVNLEPRFTNGVRVEDTVSVRLLDGTICIDRSVMLPGRIDLMVITTLIPPSCLGAARGPTLDALGGAFYGIDCALGESEEEYKARCRALWPTVAP